MSQTWWNGEFLHCWVDATTANWASHSLVQFSVLLRAENVQDGFEDVTQNLYSYTLAVRFSIYCCPEHLPVVSVLVLMPSFQSRRLICREEDTQETAMSCHSTHSKFLTLKRMQNILSNKWFLCVLWQSSQRSLSLGSRNCYRVADHSATISPVISVRHLVLLMNDFPSLSPLFVYWFML